MERHHSSIHSVQFYDTHSSLIERLAGIVSSGLLLGNSAVVEAGDEHRTPFMEAFKRMDFDVRRTILPAGRVLTARSRPVMEMRKIMSFTSSWGGVG